MNEETNKRDVGLLILRVGIGALFIYHGYPKITGGTQMWQGLGQAMGNLGITFAPAFWGFMAAVAEFVGGIVLVLGVPFRLFCALMAFNMVVATLFHLNGHGGMAMASHPIALFIVFISLLVMGAGKYSLCGCGKCRSDAVK